MVGSQFFDRLFVGIGVGALCSENLFEGGTGRHVLSPFLGTLVLRRASAMVRNDLLLTYLFRSRQNSRFDIRGYLFVPISCRLAIVVKQTKGGDLMSRMSARAIGLGAQQGWKSNLSVSR
jgi:hypothetical protein